MQILCLQMILMTTQLLLMYFDENGKMCGDVVKADYDKLLEKNCDITPVPGGIGQCTVIALLENTIDIQLKNK